LIATALQVTGEEGNIEAIEYFTNRYASMSRANIKESKNKSEGFVHLIMYGKEAKIKKYDYMAYNEIKQRLKILTKEQVAFRMKTPVLPVPTDSIQNLLKPVPRYSKESVKEPVPFIV
jgi:hypothetical protein